MLTISKTIFLVPTLQRGNAYGTAPAVRLIKDDTVSRLITVTSIFFIRDAGASRYAFPRWSVGTRNPQTTLESELFLKSPWCHRHSLVLSPLFKRAKFV